MNKPKRVSSLDRTSSPPAKRNKAAALRRAYPPARQPRGTTADAVYAALREGILLMRLRPGQPLHEKQIALEHGVSRTPVREALLRLASEKLVDIFPQSGTFVARIPIGELPEAILVRCALEDLTVRAAAEFASAAQIARLRANVDGQKFFARRNDGVGFHAIDQDFHAMIAEIAGHPNVWKLVRQVKVQVDRYCMMTLPAPGRMKALIGEHDAIVDAIARHNKTQAAAAMRAHLDWLNDSLRGISDLDPAVFEIPAQ